MVEKIRVDGESQHDKIIDGDENAELGTTRFNPENLLGSMIRGLDLARWSPKLQAEKRRGREEEEAGASIAEMPRWSRLVAV